MSTERPTPDARLDAVGLYCEPNDEPWVIYEDVKRVVFGPATFDEVEDEWERRNDPDLGMMPAADLPVRGDGPTPDARPDTARLRALCEYDDWPTAAPCTEAELLTLLDWIDAQPVRGDGPGVEELRARISDYAEGAKQAIGDCESIGASASYAEGVAWAYAVTLSAIDEILAALAAAPPATSGGTDGGEWVCFGVGFAMAACTRAEPHRGCAEMQESAS